MTRQAEVKKLDKALSKYVRSHKADQAGRATCFTCGVKKRWQEMDCGHFMTRSKYSTRWLYDEAAGLTNVQVQCKRCNMTNGGQQYLFGQKLDAVYGKGTAEEIVRLSNQTVKYSTMDLVAMRKDIEEKMRG